MESLSTKKNNVMTTIILDKDTYTKFKLIVTCQDTNMKKTMKKLICEYVKDNENILNEIISK